MAKGILARRSIAELLSMRGHAADFTASRANYAVTRLRALALLLAVLLPIWIPVDYLLLPTADFLPLAGLRLAMASLALALYFFSPQNGRVGGALWRIGLLMLIPAALYAAARVQLEMGSNDLLYGYAFFPVLLVAMLAVFPLTLLEGAAFGLPVLLLYVGLELALGTVFDPRWLGMLWLLSLVSLITLTTQLSQLRMLLDLFRRATRDSLTGVLNRRSLEARLQAEHARFERHGRPLVILRIELTNLGLVTEQHGAAIAYRLLAQLADVVGRTLRPTDILGRWSEGTLLAILPETEEATAQKLAARVRELAELTSVTLPVGQTVRGTHRVELAQPIPQERLDELLARVGHQLAA